MFSITYLRETKYSNRTISQTCKTVVGLYCTARLCEAFIGLQFEKPFRLGSKSGRKKRNQPNVVRDSLCLFTIRTLLLLLLLVFVHSGEFN